VFPVCSFCGGRPVALWYEGPDFLIERQSPGEVESDEAWLACFTCAELVRGDARERLARLGAHRSVGNTPAVTDDHVGAQREHLNQQFWKPRDSAVS